MIDWVEHDYSAKQHGGSRRQSDLGRWRGNFYRFHPLLRVLLDSLSLFDRFSHVLNCCLRLFCQEMDEEVLRMQTDEIVSRARLLDNEIKVR